MKSYVVLFLLCTYVCAEISFEDGGYSVSVSFSQNIPPQDGKNLLENMKVTLQSASEILYESTGFQFTKVKFKIPESWNESEWTVSTEDTIDSNHRTDFLVDSTSDTVFGKFPLAQQFGGCGTPGHRIIIPTAFFDEENTFPRGISLAREWLKYRYGVFDENGYFKDPLYPLYYNTPGSDRNEIKVTDCANIEITYDFKDQEGNNCSSPEDALRQRLDLKKCIISVDEENVQNLTSSLMYYKEDISNMLHVCGRDPDHPHNNRSPNKQNALCRGKSIWDIVSKSKDFGNEGIKKEYADINYVYVQETKPAVVIAWENTKKLKNKKEIIEYAIKKFMIDLPYGSKFSAFPFRNVVSKGFKLQELTTLADKQAVSTGIFSDFEVDEDGDINRAIETAAEILKPSAADPAELKREIFIITATSNKVEDSILDQLKGLCVKILFFSESDIPEEVKQYASDLPCGKVEGISLSEGPEETYKKLLEGMGENSLSYAKNKATETARIANLTQGSAIAVKVEDSVETISFWIFSKKESENFVLKLNGDTPKNGITSEIIGEILEISYSPSQPGTVELSYLYDTTPLFTQVTITSKAGEYFTAEVIVIDTTEKGDVQMPVIIYVIIRKGAYPVQHAKVLATIDGPEGLNIELDLYDDGKGDPDITQNDGIYSRYFTNFTGKGEYTVKVTATNYGQLTRIGQDENSGFRTCCGSFVPRSTKGLPEFTKVNKTKFTARSGRPDDGYKPSRISDLRIEEVTEDKIVLKWSAPGAEADSGTVQTYDIKSFYSQEQAISNFDERNAFSYTESPKKRGENEKFEIKQDEFEKKGLLYYIAIKAKNHNKTSDLSNIVEIFIPDGETTTEPDGDDKDKTKQSGTNPKTVALIVGLIVGLVILIIVVSLAVYFVVVKPKREEEKERNTEDGKKEGKDNLGYGSSTKVDHNSLNPITFVSADTLIKHHNEKTKAKTENKEPPIFKEDDFEDKNSRPKNGPNVSNIDQQPHSSNKRPGIEPPMPPKSPKRTTYV